MTQLYLTLLCRGKLADDKRNIFQYDAHVTQDGIILNILVNYRHHL